MTNLLINMNECHECNSEVSEDEAFCPYCGIAFAPIAAKAAVEKDAEAEEDLPTISGEEAESDDSESEKDDAEAAVGLRPDPSEESSEEHATDEFMDVSALKSEPEIDDISPPAPESVDSVEDEVEEFMDVSALKSEPEIDDISTPAPESVDSVDDQVEEFMDVSALKSEPEIDDISTPASESVASVEDEVEDISVADLVSDEVEEQTEADGKTEDSSDPVGQLEEEVDIQADPDTDAELGAQSGALKNDESESGAIEINEPEEILSTVDVNTDSSGEVNVGEVPEPVAEAGVDRESEDLLPEPIAEVDVEVVSDANQQAENAASSAAEPAVEVISEPTEEKGEVVLTDVEPVVEVVSESSETKSEIDSSEAEPAVVGASETSEAESDSDSSGVEPVVDDASETIKPKSDAASNEIEPAVKEPVEDLVSVEVTSEAESAPDSSDDPPISKGIAEDPDFTATIPYVPTDIGEVEAARLTDVADEASVEDPDESRLEDNADIASESPTKLGTPVPATSSDVSDEVPEVAKETVEGSPESLSSEPTPLDPGMKEPVSEVAAEEAKPYTAPNIGVEDTDGSNKTKLKPLAEGTLLNDRYEIVRRIGGGGMGAVYLANDKNLGGVLRAVKEMVQSYIEEEQQDKAINDFKRESMLLTTLEHAAIPTIYDYFFDETESRFYLVMKYISGGDLSGRLRAAPEGKLDERTVVEWGIEVADVLDYLHNHEPPIVYRDLKPANIMIDGNTGRVMLIDFGIARWVNKEEKGVTAVGTMGYAPPELFSGNVEPRSDIYSLGSTMFHLLTGADPQSNPLLIFDFDKNPRPRQINSSLSDGIENILMKAVEYNAEGRFSSTAEMRDVLTEHLRNLIAGKVTFGVSETPAPVSLADQSVFCGFCGQKIVATDMFCAFCGAKQPLAQPGVHSQAYVPPQATAKLFIQGTSDLNAPAFEIEKQENLVGRRDPMSNIFPEVDLSKFDPQTKISRKHARIWRDGENFMLEDLGSSNGTILESGTVGETRLNPKEPRRLSSGDIIKMGDTTLHFVVG